MSRGDFWSKVRKCESGCWEWTAGLFPSGYGCFWVREDSPRRGIGHPAHRVAWERLVGPIPPGMFLCHRCDNRRCVRPDHLFVGTQLDNMADRNAKGRQARGTRHPRAKLTELQVLEIRSRYAAGGTSLRKLGREYGVHSTTVLDAISGEHWSHLRKESANG